ncbi:hypothetical protein [Chroococcidiopsis sp.]|uniref:hypothetical protein n=1 Tax=Chroococcidiopsis sp. TaxID=3088168 RepID=UPI003F3A4EC6
MDALKKVVQTIPRTYCRHGELYDQIRYLNFDMVLRLHCPNDKDGNASSFTEFFYLGKPMLGVYESSSMPNCVSCIEGLKREVFLHPQLTVTRQELARLISRFMSLTIVSKF